MSRFINSKHNVYFILFSYSFAQSSEQKVLPKRCTPFPFFILIPQTGHFSKSPNIKINQTFPFFFSLTRDACLSFASLSQTHPPFFPQGWGRRRKNWIWTAGKNSSGTRTLWTPRISSLCEQAREEARLQALFCSGWTKAFLRRISRKTRTWKRTRRTCLSLGLTAK